MKKKNWQWKPKMWGNYLSRNRWRLMSFCLLSFIFVFLQLFWPPFVWVFLFVVFVCFFFCTYLFISFYSFVLFGLECFFWTKRYIVCENRQWRSLCPEKSELGNKRRTVWSNSLSSQFHSSLTKNKKKKCQRNVCRCRMICQQLAIPLILCCAGKMIFKEEEKSIKSASQREYLHFNCNVFYYQCTTLYLKDDVRNLFLSFWLFFLVIKSPIFPFFVYCSCFCSSFTAFPSVILSFFFLLILSIFQMFFSFTFLTTLFYSFFIASFILFHYYSFFFLFLYYFFSFLTVSFTPFPRWPFFSFIVLLFPFPCWSFLSLDVPFSLFLYYHSY